MRLARPWVGSVFNFLLQKRDLILGEIEDAIVASRATSFRSSRLLNLQPLRLRTKVTGYFLSLEHV